MEINSEKMLSDDEEFDPKVHDKLLEGVRLINQNHKFITKPTRFETTLKKSEFNLVKTKTDNFLKRNRKNTIAVHELAKILQNTSKHVEIGKQLKLVHKNRKVLRKPLEKPIADKIERKLKYGNTRKSLSRWDAVVTKNKTSEQLSFPLKEDEIKIIESQPREPFSYRIKSDLMKKLEVFTPQLEEPIIDEKPPEVRLTYLEMIAKRRETARMRIKESYQIQKSRQINKIKSKKYHRILKREKIKKQIKDFEQLQKNDPEAALKQLDLIDRNRIEERANLRHKNTGKWAKNLQMRAKNNKDVRQELAEQLAISRDLTKKRTKVESSDSEEEINNDEIDIEDNPNDPFNPWIKKSVKQADEVQTFMTGYRKYWETRNEDQKKLEEYKSQEDSSETSNNLGLSQTSNNQELGEMLENEKNIKTSNGDWEIEIIPMESNQIKSDQKKNISKKQLKKTDSNEKSKSKALKKKEMKEKKKLKKEILERSKQSIDNMFDEVDDSIGTKIVEKLAKIRGQLSSNEKIKGQHLKKTKGFKTADLSFKETATRPNLDQKLNEGIGLEDETVNDENELDSARKILSTKIDDNKNDDVDFIDPNKFITIKPRHLKTAIPDMINMDENIDDDENDLNADKRMTLAQAFEEDDIIADFAADKDKEVKKDITEDINLTLPGWGSWGGTGIISRPNKRFILKLPKELPRQDKNNERVIINEDGNVGIKEHLVSKLPFPFTSVKDYEASIRASIGTTFIPETAHRTLTRPAITTKLGKIINPMDENSLLQNDNNKINMHRSRTQKKIEEIKV